MLDQTLIDSYLCCPGCRGDLVLADDALKCRQCDAEYPVQDGIPCFLGRPEADVELSLDKWDAMYRRQLDEGTYAEGYRLFLESHFQDLDGQLFSRRAVGPGDTYLEIGCGPCHLGQQMASRADFVVGIDFSLSALRIARQLFADNGIENFLLVQGDILELPFRDASMDYIYGGGVIEHFQDTQRCIDQLQAALRPGGACVNSVPFLNIGSLTYRQVWGNIPAAPVLKQLAELVHIKLLGGRHMIFGYEMSFTRGRLRRMHARAGFEPIFVDQLSCGLQFDFLPGALRPAARRLASDCWLFWPMVLVTGLKERA